MKIAREKDPLNGIELTSETAEEAALLNKLWLDPSMVVAFYRHRDGSITLTLAPTREGD